LKQPQFPVSCSPTDLGICWGHQSIAISLHDLTNEPEEIRFQQGGHARVKRRVSFEIYRCGLFRSHTASSVHVLAVQLGLKKIGEKARKRRRAARSIRSLGAIKSIAMSLHDTINQLEKMSFR
jgi:hypothetical protein